MMALRACACPYGGPAPSRFGGRAGDLPRSPRWGCLARGVGGLFCLRGGRISAISAFARSVTGTVIASGMPPGPARVRASLYVHARV